MPQIWSHIQIIEQLFNNSDEQHFLNSATSLRKKGRSHNSNLGIKKKKKILREETERSGRVKETPPVCSPPAAPFSVQDNILVSQ